MNESEDSASSHLISENIYSQAIMEFQRFAGLNETGLNMKIFLKFFHFSKIFKIIFSVFSHHFNFLKQK